MAKADDGCHLLSLPRTLSRAQLSVVVGLNRAQVAELVREGLPTQKIGRQVEYPTVAALRWLVNRAWRDRWR